MKIKTLSLNNFRAFPGSATEKFTLEGKNLLVYGENGSGKSSVFQALKIFFTLNQPNSVAETQNVFSGIRDHWIEVEFDDGQPPARWNGPPALVARTPDLRVTEGALRRGCFDYRALLDTNYGHGDNAVNFFNIAIGPLLGDYSVTIDSVTKKTIAELWDECSAAFWKDSDRTLPTRRTSKVLRRVITAVTTFNLGFRYALAEIMPWATALLEELPVDGMSLDDLDFDAVTYNPDRKSFDGMKLTPAIIFRNHSITYPQHFLNEARLSALGLAMYLAGRLASVPPGGSELKLLVMDDVLIGIDLSNRLPLLDLLRKRFGEWQIVLLTHDRVWYEMARMHMSSSGAWKCIEIYEGVCPIRGIPAPNVRKVNEDAAAGCIEQAQVFLNDGHVPAAANYARVAFELTLKVFCDRFHIPVPYSLEARMVNSEAFLSSVEKWLKQDLAYIGLAGVLEHVKLYRRVVMNPYSHASPPTIARSEVQGALNSVRRLFHLDRQSPEMHTTGYELAQQALVPGPSSQEQLEIALCHLRRIFQTSFRDFCVRKNVRLPLDAEPTTYQLCQEALRNHSSQLKDPNLINRRDLQKVCELLVQEVSDTALDRLTISDLQSFLLKLHPDHNNKNVLDRL